MSSSWYRKLTLVALEDRAVPAAGITLSANSIAENQYSGQLVGNFTSEIPLGVGYTSYQLVSGTGDTNNANFFIGGDQLRISTMFNFETTTSQSIRVRAQASNGELVEQAFTVNITNVNEAPYNLALSNSSVNENSPATTLVGTLSSTDPDVPDTTTYSLTTNPGGRFQINGDRLEVAAGANLNFEGQQNFYVQVRATDVVGAFTEQGYLINVLNVNEAPSNIGLIGDTVQEGSPSGAYIGTLLTYDEDGGLLTYSLTDSAGGRFAINGSSLVVGDASLINFEAATTHSVTVRVTDSGGLNFDATFTINVTNRNEAPTDIALSNSSVTLPASPGAAVGNLSATDPDAGSTFNFILVNNAGGKFQIVGTQLQITDPALFPNTPISTHDVRVMVQDQFGMPYEETFTITVNNSAAPPANLPPTNITLSGNTIPENSPVGQFVAYVSATDPDSFTAPTISLFDDAGGRFAMSGNNLVVNNSALLNFEANTSHQVTIRATDIAGAHTDQAFTINVTNLNEAPTDIALSNNTVTIPAASGTAVGTLSATDQDAGSSFNFVLINNAGGKFQITGNQLQITDSALFPSNPTSTFDIVVLVIDQGGLTYQETFTINVTNNYVPPANLPPTNITLSGNTIPENSPVGQFVAYVSATDPDSFTAPTISLFDDAGGRFAMSGNNLVVNNSALLNFEANTSHQVTIRATDIAGAHTDQAFTINVTNLNEAPTDIALSNNNLNYPSLANDYVVGNFTATDPDVGDTAQFILIDNAGGKFKLVGNQLQVANRDLFLYDLRSSYDVRVLVLDSFGMPYQETFTINFNV